MLRPEDIAAKWARNTAAAGPSIQAGVQAMQARDNPMEKAAARQSAWLSGCQEAARTNRFAAGCRSVSFEDWRRAVIQKGIPNFQAGVQMGTPKMERFLRQFVPYIQRGVEALPARGTLQQNKDRASRMIDHLAAFRFDRGGGGGGGVLDNLGVLPR